MKITHYIFAFILSLGTALQIGAQPKYDVDIEALLKRMSIEEKAGQMTQIDLGVISEGNICALKQPQILNSDKLRQAIAVYHIGSILNVGCGSGTMSLNNWHQILNSIHEANSTWSKNKIPILYGIDAIHGANYTMGATLFPQQIAQAASWNPQLVKKGYEITAYEVRATGIPWNFSPVLDLGRQPLWSRFFETFGEDVHLAKTMSKVAIEGYQGNDISNPYKVTSCMKHFLGYSMPLSGADRTPAWISDRELREYFLPTFKTAIEANARTVMINSGDINGTPVHANYDILTTLLRNELGFTGVAVTDWEDVYKLVNVHRVAKTKKDAVKMAIMSGVDMSMTPNDFEFTTLLVELVKEGSIPESRLDLSVRRILQLKKDLGLFSQTRYPIDQYPLFGSAEHAQVSLDLAKESITLLKNKDATLPLQSQEKIFLCGPAANSLNLLNGAWTHTWQGVDSQFNTKNKPTILQALRDIEGVEVSYHQGVELDSVIDIERCVRKARNADKIVVCLGEKPATEIPGNIDDLTLSEPQIQLVEELANLGKPLILLCNFNRPRIIKRIVPLADAILYCYLLGDEGGRAIAQVLTGRENPSGKLPFTYPHLVNALVHYDRKHTEDMDVDFSENGFKPEFIFGYGQSYTNFEYSNLRFSDSNLNGNAKLTIMVDVKNIGKMQGKEVVQFYYNDLVASITPSMRKLFAYKKIELQPQQKQTVEFTCDRNDFSFINKELKRITEPGEIEIIVDNLKKILYVQ